MGGGVGDRQVVNVALKRNLRNRSVTAIRSQTVMKPAHPAPISWSLPGLTGIEGARRARRGAGVEDAPNLELQRPPAQAPESSLTDCDLCGARRSTQEWGLAMQQQG